MKLRRIFKIILLILASLIITVLTHAQENTIEVIDSSVKSKSESHFVSCVQLHIKSDVRSGDFASESVLTLINDNKGPGSIVKIYQNKEKTIVGFNASNALINYKINLIFLVNNEQVINQNLNLKLSEILAKNLPKLLFDSSGLYLANIIDRKIVVGFRCDSPKGCFKFQVKINKDGTMKFVPGSFKLGELPSIAPGVMGDWGQRQ